MSIDNKKYLSKAKEDVIKACLKVEKKYKDTEKSLERSRKIFKTLTNTDKIIESTLIKYKEKRVKELEYLKYSPYFVRCDVLYENEKEKSVLYFAKYSLNDESIYSWITPASVMRFENPGNVVYKRPDGTMQKAILIRKDQFMIVDGNIKFFSIESIDIPRTLIYQEFFSNRKTEFVLPEIISRMEKAQDRVIRAEHVGPFLISGPAGSGKTTLALHRMAYLLQSPDLAETYNSSSKIVFVQDVGTKKYFAHLLPELGINDVLITTFQEWAFSVLELKVEYMLRYGNNEYERDIYEFSKFKALKASSGLIYRKSSIFSILGKQYKRYFSEEQQKLFKKQQRENVVDRVDLIFLLMSFKKTVGYLGTVQDCYIGLKNGSVRKERSRRLFNYSLAIIDEFQNYTPQQLALINNCINQKNRSIIYVGDMAQQVQLGTIREWGEINETIHKERIVVLDKVYRNTKDILNFVKSLGYNIGVSDKLKSGHAVIEHDCLTSDDEIAYIARNIKDSKFSNIGILAKDQEYLSSFKKYFENNKDVYAMTMNEAQGVEFEAVFIVGICKEAFFMSHKGMDMPTELIVEKERINRDLLYVALTRAISELHILGRERLSEII